MTRKYFKSKFDSFDDSIKHFMNELYSFDDARKHFKSEFGFFDDSKSILRVNVTLRMTRPPKFKRKKKSVKKLTN